jgi:hypothetical protein
MIGMTLLGKSVEFHLNTGEMVLMKVTGVSFSQQFQGFDDEGMNRVIDMDSILCYQIPGSGVIRSEII